MLFKLRKSAFSLRTKNRLNTLLAIEEERVCWYFLAKFVTPIFISFSLVDWVAVPGSYLIGWMLVRSLASILAIAIIALTRGRIPYGMRNLLIYAPYYLTIEGIMVYEHLVFTPYFAGLVVCLFSASLLFAIPPKISVPVYTLLSIPTFMGLYAMRANLNLTLLGFAMIVGSIFFCAVNAAVLRDKSIGRFIALEALNKMLRTREDEIRSKAAELLKRKQFESQFSPQVVTEILKDAQQYETLRSQSICVLVCDIKSSSSKSKALEPARYSEVVEEVFDSISAGCLKWNLTVDKFTGDGAQAFAGFPSKSTDDLQRTVKAATEILSIINGRRDYLESRWNGSLGLKFSICEGEALVGFLGGGAMKSFTAIGQTVSLGHRICSEADENSIFIYSSARDVVSEELFSPKEFELGKRSIKGVRGFEDSTFNVLKLKPRNLAKYTTQSLGRCPTCATPLVLDESANGMPKVICPACSLRSEKPGKKSIVNS